MGAYHPSNLYVENFALLKGLEGPPNLNEKARYNFKDYEHDFIKRSPRCHWHGGAWYKARLCKLPPSHLEFVVLNYEGLLRDKNIYDVFYLNPKKSTSYQSNVGSKSKATSSTSMGELLGPILWLKYKELECIYIILEMTYFCFYGLYTGRLKK